MGALPSYKTAPQISFTNPPSAAQGVPQSTSVSATFDMPLDPATINADNFLVSGQGGGRSGTVSYDPLTCTATFTPDAPFQAGERITAQLTSSITSLWEMALNEDYIWDFEITTSTAVEASEPGSIPDRFALFQNYPNPFNAQTQIRFSIPSSGRVALRIYNTLGQLVDTLVDENLPAGNHQAAWNGSDHIGRALASGVYFCRLEAGEMRDVRRMMLLR